MRTEKHRKLARQEFKKVSFFQRVTAFLLLSILLLSGIIFPLFTVGNTPAVLAASLTSGEVIEFDSLEPYVESKYLGSGLTKDVSRIKPNPAYPSGGVIGVVRNPLPGTSLRLLQQEQNNLVFLNEQGIPALQICVGTYFCRPAFATETEFIITSKNFTLENLACLDESLLQKAIVNLKSSQAKISSLNIAMRDPQFGITSDGDILFHDIPKITQGGDVSETIGKLGKLGIQLEEALETRKNTPLSSSQPKASGSLRPGLGKLLGVVGIVGNIVQMKGVQERARKNGVGFFQQYNCELLTFKFCTPQDFGQVEA